MLTPDKAYLLESRLLPVARKRSCKSLPELAALLRGKQDAALIRDIVEAMTTNESFSFATSSRSINSRRSCCRSVGCARGRRSDPIWSAACSSGQEPYTLAMILASRRPSMPGWRIEIIATDLST